MNWRYIKNEIKAIFLIAYPPSLFAFFASSPLWWERPEFGAVVFGGVFAVFAVIGILAGIRDDYRLSVRIERKKK